VFAIVIACAPTASGPSALRICRFVKSLEDLLKYAVTAPDPPRILAEEQSQ
jgi:hypothetical protein